MEIPMSRALGTLRSACLALMLPVPLLAQSSSGPRPQPSHAITKEWILSADSGRTALPQLAQAVQSVRSAQDEFFSRSGRYTADSRELEAAGLRVPRGVILNIDVGDGWFVCYAEAPGRALLSSIVRREGGPRVVATTLVH